MDEDILNKRYQIQTYLDHARQALDSAASSIEHGFYGTAINRAYYAIFYATSGLLLTKDISRGKHAGVIAAFRQHFVKPGLIEPEYSDLYGDVMDARVDSDYEMAFEADQTTASERLEDARRFVERVIRHLLENGWL
jgi:uncharacterized protein (UPF0332 family)